MLVNKRTLFAAMSLILMVVSLMVVVAPPSDAATHCHTFNRHWSLKEAGGPKIGWVELHVEACTNGKTFSTTSTTESDETGPGTFAGFDISVSKPRRVTYNSGGKGKSGFAAIVADGRTKACGALTFGTVCSYSGNWRIRMDLRMVGATVRGVPYKNPPGIDTVIGSRGFRHKWYSRCTNSVCRTRFS